MGYRVAVVGATGNVGREILNILAERQFPVDEVAAIASEFTSGTISGTSGSIRNSELLSITVQPAFAALGA